MTTAPSLFPPDGASASASAAALLESRRFLQSTLDALSAHLAVLDGHGTIIAVNAAWNRFGRENNFKSSGGGVGLNYLSVCDTAAGSSAEGAAAVMAAGIRAVAAGQSEEFQLEYSCHSPEEQRWFIVRVTRFGGKGPVRVVVAHENISARKRAEQVLQASEHLMRLALEAGNLGVFEHALDENRQWVSSKFCQIVGLPPQTSVSPEAWGERIHPDDRNRVLAGMERMVSEHAAFDLEYRLGLPNGNLRWIRAMSSPVMEHGKVSRIHGVVQDITDRKRAESELRKLSRAVEQSPASIVITDREGGIEYVNPKFCALTGYAFEEVRGQNPRVLKSGDMPDEAYRQLWATLTEGKEWRGEFHNRKKNGELYWESASISPIRDAGGNTTHFIAVKEDITERKKSESALRESDERYRALFDRSLDCLFVNDFEGRILDLNPSALALLGYRREELAALTFSALLIPDDLPRAVRVMEEVRAVGTQEALIEFTVLRKDGTHVEVEIKSALILRDGQPYAIQGMARDITQRRRAEKAMQEQIVLRERLAKIASTAPGIIYSFRLRPDGSTCIPYVSPTIEEFGGVRADDLVEDASPLLRLIHPEDLVHVQKSIAESARTMAPWRIEFRVRHPIKGLFWVEGQSTPEGQADGSILWHGFMSDVSERKRADEALATEQNLLNSLITTTPDMVYFKDRAGRFTRVNEALAKRNGLPDPNALLGKTDFDFFGEQYAHETGENEKRIMATGQPMIDKEESNVRPDGQIAWVSSTKMPLRDSTGTIVGIMGISRDITERKRAEESLRAAESLVRHSEERYRSLIDGAQDVIMTIGLDGAFTSLNPAVEAIKGLSRAEWIGRPFAPIVHPDDRPLALEMFQRVLRGEQTPVHELRGNPRLMGSVVMEMTLTTQKDESGKIIGLLGIGRDITERKRAEATRDRLAAILETTTDLVSIANPAGELVYLNRAGRTLLGVGPEEDLAKTVISEFLPDPTHHPILSEGIPTAIRLGTWAGETILLSRAGREFTVSQVILAQKAADGTPEFFSSIMRDLTAPNRARAEMENLKRQVTEHEESENRAHRALEHEQELNRIKDRFVSLVSHEFRSPLCVIDMAASLLDGYMERMTGVERSGSIHDIQRAVVRMTQMMEDLLVNEQFGAGKMECLPSRVDVEALARQLIAEELNRPGANCPIEFTLAPTAHEAVVDGVILRHILGNLLSNAVKYSPQAQPVTLEVKRVTAASPTESGGETPVGDRLQIKVSDAGIGIPAADLAKLFQTFHRATNVGNRPGTGMGLAIVKQCVDLHQGTIRIESDEGKGTTVWVYLPVAASGSLGEPAAPVGPALSNGPRLDDELRSDRSETNFPPQP